MVTFERDYSVVILIAADPVVVILTNNILNLKGCSLQHYNERVDVTSVTSIIMYEQL